MQDDMNVILAELRKDILYIRKAIDDKFVVYDRYIDEGKIYREKVLRAEIKIELLEKEDDNRKSAINQIRVGVILAIVGALLAILLKRF